MKITRFETIPIQGRAMILKMLTDEGLVGYGEPMNYEHWRVVAQAVDETYRTRGMFRLEEDGSFADY